jgi:hypothetical protein
MKTIITVVGVLMLICPCIAMGQKSTMYDYSYTGPRNQAGIPKFKYMQQPRPVVMPPQQQAQYAPQGQYLPQGQYQQQRLYYNTPMYRAYSRVRSVGQRIVGWLPAPLRGAPQFQPSSKDGYVTIVNVPGTR